MRAELTHYPVNSKDATIGYYYNLWLTKVRILTGR